MAAHPLEPVPQPVAFFLADYAAVENGKVYTSGAFWNRMLVVEFPSVQQLSVVVVFDVPFSAHGHSFTFTIRFEDADAQQLGPRINGQMDVGQTGDGRLGDESVIPFVARVEGLVLPEPGDFSAVLEIDGGIIARWPFRAATAQ